MAVQFNDGYIWRLLWVGATSLILVGCSSHSHPRCELKVDPITQVPTGKTVEIKANLIYPPDKLEFAWYVDKGTLNPQVSDPLTAIYTAPTQSGTYRVRLELQKEGIPIGCDCKIDVQVIPWIEEVARSSTGSNASPEGDRAQSPSSQTQLFNRGRLSPNGGRAQIPNPAQLPAGASTSAGSNREQSLGVAQPLVGGNSAAGEERGRSNAPPATVDPPDKAGSSRETSPRLNNQLMITTFSPPLQVQLGAFYPTGSGYAKETCVKVSDSDQMRGEVIRIEYDVSHPGDYAGFWLKFQLPDNFRPTESSLISFWLRGDSKADFTRRLKVELKLKSWGWRTLYISGITDKWQQFRLPLSRFEKFEGWDGPNEFVLTFENSEATAPKGVIYIDDISLGVQ